MVCVCMCVCVCERERERESVCAYMYTCAIATEVYTALNYIHTFPVKYNPSPSEGVFLESRF